MSLFWLTGGEMSLVIDPVLRGILELGERFHGHVGPFLVTGVRMAWLAAALLGEVRHIHSKTGLQPPMSCITDGLQISTALTLCNKGISVEDEGTPTVVFTGENGKVLTIRLRNAVLEQMRQVTDDTMAEWSERIAVLPADELFEIEESSE